MGGSSACSRLLEHYAVQKQCALRLNPAKSILMTDSTISGSTSSVRRLPVDAEHLGIRLALPVLAVGAFLLAYAVLNGLPYPANLPAGCFVIAGSIVAAAVVGFLADRYLKKIWQSGRVVELTPDGLRLLYGSTQRAVITFTDPINALAWKFTVRKGGGRIPRGWQMMAVKLAQGDSDENPPMLLYIFVPPDQAETMPATFQFTALTSRAEVEQGALGLRETGIQRLLLAAEDERYHTGAELQAADFKRVLESVAPHLQTLI